MELRNKQENWEELKAKNKWFSIGHILYTLLLNRIQTHKSFKKCDENKNCRWFYEDLLHQFFNKSWIFFSIYVLFKANLHSVFIYLSFNLFRNIISISFVWVVVHAFAKSLKRTQLTRLVVTWPTVMS